VAKPQRIPQGGQRWRPNVGLDPAAYLIHPGDVRAPGKHRPGNLRHARPYLVCGKAMFVFPVGTEGFRRSGQAQLGLHHHIGGHYVTGRTIHREEARIELTGTFPGTTSQQNMVDCITVLTAIAPRNGMSLYMPGIFGHLQFVLPETWDFNHDPTDRTHSIDFTISFVRCGTGQKVTDPHGIVPPPQPLVKSVPRGTPSRVFRAKDGARSFQAIAATVYNNSAYWQKLAEMNQKLVHSAKLPAHKVPTHRWPIGTAIYW